MRNCTGNDCPCKYRYTFELLIDNCINLHAAYNIADCNKVYNLCSNVSSESSSQGWSTTGHVAHSNKQPINCTLIATINRMNDRLMVTCQNEDNQLTFTHC